MAIQSKNLLLYCKKHKKPCFRETEGPTVTGNSSVVDQTLVIAVMKMYWQKIVSFFCYYFLRGFDSVLFMISATSSHL